MILFALLPSATLHSRIVYQLTCAGARSGVLPQGLCLQDTVPRAKTKLSSPRRETEDAQLLPGLVASL